MRQACVMGTRGLPYRPKFRDYYREAILSLCLTGANFDHNEVGSELKCGAVLWADEEAGSFCIHSMSSLYGTLLYPL